jgi:hypothetical protein
MTFNGFLFVGTYSPSILFRSDELINMTEVIDKSKLETDIAKELLNFTA